MKVNWNLNKIYTKSGEIDGRCQQARHWQIIDDAIDAQINEDEQHRKQILADWALLSKTERAFEKLSNSHTYRLADYAQRTSAIDSEYYINRDGLLTTWTCDPSLNKIDDYHEKILKNRLTTV